MLSFGCPNFSTLPNLGLEDLLSTSGNFAQEMLGCRRMIQNSDYKISINFNILDIDRFDVLIFSDIDIQNFTLVFS